MAMPPNTADRMEGKPSTDVPKGRGSQPIPGETAWHQLSPLYIDVFYLQGFAVPSAWMNGEAPGQKNTSLTHLTQLLV